MNPAGSVNVGAWSIPTNQSIQSQNMHNVSVSGLQAKPVGSCSVTSTEVDFFVVTFNYSRKKSTQPVQVVRHFVFTDRWISLKKHLTKSRIMCSPLHGIPPVPAWSPLSFYPVHSDATNEGTVYFELTSYVFSAFVCIEVGVGCRKSYVERR